MPHAQWLGPKPTSLATAWQSSPRLWMVHGASFYSFILIHGCLAANLQPETLPVASSAEWVRSASAGGATKSLQVCLATSGSYSHCTVEESTAKDYENQA
jgi:hypothetical protein